MPAIHIDSPASPFMLLEGNWNSPGWAAKHAAINPTKDPFLDSLLIIRWNLWREHARRATQMRRLYWDRTTEWDSLIAEGEAEMFASYYKDFFALESLRTMEIAEAQGEIEALDRLIADPTPVTYLASISDAIDARAEEISEASSGGLTSAERSKFCVEYNMTRTLVPPSQELRPRWNEQLLQGESRYTPTPIIHEKVDYLRLRHYRDHVSHFLHDLEVSDFVLTREFNASRRNNALEGASGRNRTLLVNHDIPLPTPSTISAWLDYAGLFAKRVTPLWASQLERFCLGQRAMAIVSYMLPMMPATKEHTYARGSLVTDDSHSDHSLGIKSPGHKRSLDGRVDYGLWRRRSVILTESGTSFVLEDQLLSQIHDANFASTMLWSMLPRLTAHHVRKHDVSLALIPHRFGVHLNALESLHGLISDPWIASHVNRLHYLNFRMSYPEDTSWRYIAKALKLHFRFDNNDTGMEAAAAWIEAFESSLYTYLRLDAAGLTRLRIYDAHFLAQSNFQAAMDNGSEAAVGMRVTKRTKAGTITFDLSHLNTNM